MQPKDETELGFEELRREVREGHVLGCHWGGRYGSQLRKHTASLSRPEYDSDGDGIVDRVTDPGNALESELLQCIRRGAEAYAAEGRAGERPALVRLPLWVYAEGDRDARPAYTALGCTWCSPTLAFPTRIPLGRGVVRFLACAPSPAGSARGKSGRRDRSPRREPAFRTLAAEAYRAHSAGSRRRGTRRA
ncbi:MAG TPA: hypothetical protein VKM54_25635 [Myxococcota bacterium]|nr:hypothetical protein [Myxococcota bacterium]